jgi:uncharacterized protein (TIGR03435 family)
MRVLTNLACFFMLLVPAARSQTAIPPGPLAFEVASIRHNPGPWREIQGLYSSGPNLRLIAWSAKSLIMEAYNLMEHEVVCPVCASTGTPDLYDILAKAEGDAPRTRTEFRRMLQSLLADRFQLRFHRETREFSIYALVVGKNGPAFRETPSGASLRTMHGVDGRKQTLDLSFASMDMLAKELNSYFFVDRPVLNKAGLTGQYDIKLAATPEFKLRNDAEPGDIDIFHAVQSQLGLKLESQKGDVEVLLVDHIDKPSAN